MRKLPLAASRPLRAGIYARYSSEQQRDASIEDQVRICRARAEREGWQVVEVYVDHAMSGASSHRPGYQALLAAMVAGAVDVVLSESLDRLSRDQEHVAGFHKRAIFAGVRIVTLAEGEVSELHVGLKGTMGALYLKDLADKTRRGLEGRVRQGRSGGGLSYGYRVVRGPIGRDGEAERGLREIDLEQATVVRRIFERFAAGEGPKAIAISLNRDGIAGPRGGIWQAGTIRGQAGRDTGILRNRLYIGELVWNQRRWLKDPGTGRRVARGNAAAVVVTEPVADLRVVEQEVWDRVQQRLLAHRAEVDETARPRFWEQRRAVHILTGRVFCGGCGTALHAVGRDYLACRVAAASGPCENRTRVRRGRLEARVLDALSGELMRPDLVAVFVESFTAEWNRLAGERAAGAGARQRELATVQRKLDGLIDAIADGLRSSGLQQRMTELETRRASLIEEIAAGRLEATPPALHPRLAETYRRRVESLQLAHASGACTEVREALRALIARVEVHGKVDGEGEPWIELIGHLAALLR
ncbi:DNA invertase Pin-like site-specific DNA recombinase, partial [Humitalea rosea]